MPNNSSFQIRVFKNKLDCTSLDLCTETTTFLTPYLLLAVGYSVPLF